MSVPQGFLDMVSKDIERLYNISNLSGEELLTLHREIDGRYQACTRKRAMPASTPPAPPHS